MPFLTPEPPDVVLRVELDVPDTFVPYVVGAILEMDNFRHWGVFGSLSTDDTLFFVGYILDSIAERTLAGGRVTRVLYAGDQTGSAVVTDKNGNIIVVQEENTP